MMSMSMGMSMGQRLEQRQVLTTAQRMELRMELAQRMGLSMRQLLEDGPCATDEQYEQMVETLAQTASQQGKTEHIDTLRQGLLNPSIREQLLANRTAVSLPSQQIYQRVAALALFAACEGNVEVEAENGGTHTLRTTQGKYLQAWENPAKLEKDMRENIDLLNAMKGQDSQGIVQEIGENRAALDIHSVLDPHVRIITKILSLASSIGDGTSRPFQEYFRDVVVLEKLLPIISERMQARFASGYMKMSRRDSAEMHAVQLLNTIGEYVLVSMGIVAPELFILKRGTVNEIAVADLREAAMDQQRDIDALLQKHRFQTQGVFFGNRWHVQGKRLSGRTDESVRSFITDTIRDQREEVLAAVDFPQFLDEARGIVGAVGSRIEDRKDADHELRLLLTRTLESDAVKTVLLKHIRGAWYGKLHKFMAGKS
ncbi:MAG: hypothetical protein G01um101425_214 [Candidatus Peregrinibacteria bacterium Gr01-1014_25]|nr:MAG: hypothetical protein G01um101425_214 [Candidatus Peregrinibacteria bacterium Gr01-1014_25]